MFKIKNLKLINPALALRIGLGLTLIYAGVNMFLNPFNWIGFIPRWIGNIIDPQTFLYIHSTFELVLGLILIIGLWLPLAALLMFLNMFAILLFFGVDDITFRDFGLLMAALALFLLAVERKSGSSRDG
ncbi:MAG: DoxX family protein [Patescibacteria group bacterium]|nr:DoxX family protein [Patescibacteria group bacterium]